jgi:adenosylhomocysteine nucleosidase
MRENPGEAQSIPEAVLVCFAVKEEARYFIAALGREDDRVRTLITGMGHANADLRLSMAVAARRPAMVITSGFAGGLDPKLGVGQVVFEADPDTGLAGRLIRVGGIEGNFYCAEHVAVTAAEKAELWKSTGADAVEMESGVIRSLCRKANIPSATVRVISDTADQDLPLDFNALMTSEQRISYVRLAWCVATRPWKIPALKRLQKQTAAAAKNLGKVLAAAILKAED